MAFRSCMYAHTLSRLHLTVSNLENKNNNFSDFKAANSTAYILLFRLEAECVSCTAGQTTWAPKYKILRSHLY